MAENTKILIADDDVELLALLARHLRTQHYDLIEASDGHQALDLARRHQPDLLILDVMMPGLSGWEVAKRIRDDDALRGMGIIMLTGIGVSLNALTSPLYGADEKLDKPFDFGDLDEKIEKVLASRRGKGA